MAESMITVGGGDRVWADDSAVPTSLLVGDLDRDWLIDSNRAAAERIPGCVFVELSGVDHLPPLRVPDRVIDLVRTTAGPGAPS